LSAAERVIFNEIIDELPKGEWTDHMIRIAADLARMIADARAACLIVVAISRRNAALTDPIGSVDTKS